MPFFKRELPPQELIDHETWKEFRNFGVQWSKLVAWSWTDLNEAGPEEPTLRAFFINRLRKQAQNVESFVKCTTPDPVLTSIIEDSGIIKSLLMGETEDVFPTRLTLSKVLETYTNQPLMTTANKDLKAIFKERFIVGVITDSFVGRIIYAEGKDATSPPEDKYILELAYPPKPQFSDSTLTKEMLSDWLNTPDGDPPISYDTPPSAYIPWSGC